MIVLNMEERADRIVTLHSKLSEMIANLPLKVPEEYKQRVLDQVLNDKKILDLINGIKDRRAPRFMMVGCTGAGKSSLLNAMTSRYLSETSTVRAGTSLSQLLSYKQDERVLFEVLDTRGIGEPLKREGLTLSPEEQLKEDIDRHDPDAILFVVSAINRAHIAEDIQTVKAICKISSGKPIPVIAVLTRVDSLDPDDMNNPKEYPPEKKEQIEQCVKQIRNILKEQGVECEEVIPVSSKIIWSEPFPEKIPRADWARLKIKRDYRYNIDKLIDTLTNKIDMAAAIQLMMTYKVEYASKKIAEKFVVTFSSIASGIAISPIPFSDLPFLCGLQVLLVSIVAYLGGVNVTKENLVETVSTFIMSLGIVGGAGFLLRTVVQQAGKFLNILPGAGMVVSAGAAYSGTYAIGKAAIAYFIEGGSMDSMDSVMKTAMREGTEAFKKDEKSKQD